MAKITKEMIARILSHVGGAANVAQAGNCMTRLRLTLRDEGLADTTAIRQIDGVMGVIVSDEQFQVVLGPGKAQTAAEMMNGCWRRPLPRRRWPMSRRRENRR